MDNDVTEANRPGEPLPRRRFVRAGLGGAVVSLLPFLSERAAASTPPDSGAPTTTAPPATTTTAPAKRPTESDVPLLGFAEGAELAAKSLYDVALRSLTDLDDLTRSVLVTIRENHLAYGNALSGLLGRLTAGEQDGDLVEGRTPDFGGSLEDVLAAAADLESTLVATHLDLLGQLEGGDAAELIASFVVTEARHGTVLVSLGGSSDLDELLVSEEADALAPAEG